MNDESHAGPPNGAYAVDLGVAGGILEPDRPAPLQQVEGLRARVQEVAAQRDLLIKELDQYEDLQRRHIKLLWQCTYLRRAAEADDVPATLREMIRSLPDR